MIRSRKEIRSKTNMSRLVGNQMKLHAFSVEGYNESEGSDNEQRKLQNLKIKTPNLIMNDNSILPIIKKANK